MHRAPAQLLTFAIEGQRFGIRLDDVREVIRAVRPVRLPKAPLVVEGLIDLRGSVVAVFDVRARFRLPARPVEPADHIVVAQARQRVVGLRVDCVTGVLTLAEDAVEAIGAVAPASEYVAGVAKLPDGLLLIHDLATFLSDAEAQALDDAFDNALGERGPA